MKKTLIIMAVSLGFSAFANAATRGYLYTDRRGEMYFDGLNDAGEQGSGFQINFAIRMGSITQAQYKAMSDCMSKKTTHAIQVVENITPVSVPSDIRGRNTTFHSAKYVVACVPAPGFLQVWRQKMGAQ